MAYTHHEWPGIIRLDLSKKTYSGCRLSGDGYVRRRNFTGKMTKEEKKTGTEGFLTRSSQKIS